MLGLGGLVGALAGADATESAAEGAARVPRSTGGFSARGGEVRFRAAFAAGVFRVVAARFFCAAPFFRVVARLRPTVRFVRRLRAALVFVFDALLVRGLRRVADLPRVRLLERAAIVGFLPCSSARDSTQRGK
jgi:hypothetical protein